MTEQILDALVDCLKAAGIKALRAYPAEGLRRAESCVCVGMKSCQAVGGGMGEYLGMLERGDGSEPRELYGLRLAAEITLRILAPTAAECAKRLDELSAALRTLPKGIKAQKLVCGEVKPDKSCGMVCCEALLQATTHLVAESDGETGAFRDFELRGVIRNAE